MYPAKSGPVAPKQRATRYQEIHVSSDDEKRRTTHTGIVAYPLTPLVKKEDVVDQLDR
jgi:hypothetical protein